MVSTEKPSSPHSAHFRISSATPPLPRKKHIYGDVLRRATERQQKVLDAWRAKQADKNA